MFRLFKLFVRGSYIGNQLSWGKDKAMFFTKFHVGLISSLITLPLSVYVSIDILGDLFFMVGMVPINSGLLYMAISSKWLRNKNLYPDPARMSVDNIRKERFISNFIYFILSVTFVLVSWEIADFYY